MSTAIATAVLISGSGTNLQALIDARNADPAFPADLQLVISNRADAAGLARAERAGIRTLVIPHRDYASREEFDAAIDEALEEAGIEFVCLAGFMRILTQTFMAKWRERMLNIHPSLLPAFTGNRAHEQVLASTATLSGCTVHAVTEELDGGPIVGQVAVPRHSADTLDSLSARVRQAEHLLYPAAVRVFLTGDQTGADALTVPSDMLMSFNTRTRYRR
ncbi:phosphoribosylglycinamide formyltransferase [Parvularcula sp. LCG005]|uniref:phosphoribosylglycinamide formyltransferase n=1 Tax=Parvularcula sp. LCG005 TaxID=3078805 RepID=UPI002942CD4D|nr:phosphoribosylglycinamide formyltransferase [Parvularcula sp. LCG005]WOI54649.1 phosphoribosylglycinamide formyltransferase [Parvularcula sp. LCG005]